MTEDDFRRIEDIFVKHLDLWAEKIEGRINLVLESQKRLAAHMDRRRLALEAHPRGYRVGEG